MGRREKERARTRQPERMFFLRRGAGRKAGRALSPVRSDPVFCNTPDIAICMYICIHIYTYIYIPVRWQRKRRH